MTATIHFPFYTAAHDAALDKTAVRFGCDDLSDLLALERKLEDILRTGQITKPPSLLGTLFHGAHWQTRDVSDRERSRFHAMLVDVKTAIEAATA